MNEQSMQRLETGLVKVERAVIDTGAFNICWALGKFIVGITPMGKIAYAATMATMFAMGFEQADVAKDHVEDTIHGIFAGIRAATDEKITKSEA